MDQNTLSDAEFALLGLISETGSISGYGLMMLAATRGMSHWANLSASNVYKHLKALRGTDLIDTIHDVEKRGRGPSGLLYSSSAHGHLVLRNLVEQSIVDAREQSTSFKLALAFSGCVPAKRLATLFSSRESKLRSRLADIEAAKMAQPNTAESRSASLLFEYVMQGVAHEVQMARNFAQLITGECS
ncbi:hypothetical protein GTP23_13365 [Pseudoduganella sp. FT93W]|uniref:Transcription regulator PadR N-terminal domain-containing protein n=1 Tax=Duganella fentianensis TaxID=2692177 RepID=A0A845HYG6_9BURK|nr:hypothetical protein [Duganella fentianensis]MYN46039.1 hypothetical protein [Duganella fentianensis]